jgi:hypothetical protein
MSITIGKKIIEKYPDKVPIIIEFSKVIQLIKPKNDNVLKMLVSNYQTTRFIHTELNKYVNLNPAETILVYCNNKMMPLTELIDFYYQKNKNPQDDCLHLFVTTENTFG